MDLAKIKELVAHNEDVLFGGCFKESLVRFNMSTRRNVKRDFYIEAFNEFIDCNRTISNAIQIKDAALIERSKKCQNEASRLLDIVYCY